MRKGNTVGDEVLIATYNSRNRTVTDGHLTEIFSAVGQRYGYEDVKAEFAPLKDFKGTRSWSTERDTVEESSWRRRSPNRC